MSSVTWQWAKSDTESGTYANISGATSASYTPVVADAGKWLRATASYTDAEGSGKSAEAVAAAAVADTTGPSVTGALAITSGSGVYTADDTIEVTVTFDEAIVVTGTPELRIRVGSGSGSEKTATCARKDATGEDAKKLVCSYTVASGDEDTDGVSVEANKLSLPAGSTIKDSSNNDATLTHAALLAQGAHKVDAVAPAAPSALALASGTTSPGNDATPPVEVTVGETGGKVTLYGDSACATAASAATDVTDTSSPYKVTVDATAIATDGSVTFRARHADAAGNVSACSTATVAYVYDGTEPGITFPSGVTPTVGTAATITLTDATSKVAKHGAIAVDGSTGAATDCDSAAEIGAGSLTTLGTPLASVNYSYTPPADSAGKKVCVYAEDAAGNSDSSLWGTAIAALQPPVAPTGLTAVKDGRFAIDLSWTAPAAAAGRAAATGYEIQRSANGTDGWADLATVTRRRER